MKRYDPRHLSDTLRASSAGETPAGEKLVPSPAKTDLTMEKGEDPNQPCRIEIPNAPTEALRENVLPCIDGSIAIDTVPEGASVRFLKKILQRILRVATRRQVDFNFNTAYALRLLNEHAGQLNQTVDQIVRQLGPLESRLDAKMSRIWESFNEKLEEIRSEQHHSARLVQERMDQLQAFAQQLGGDAERRFQEIYRTQEHLSASQDSIRRDLEIHLHSIQETIAHVRSSQHRIVRAFRSELANLGEVSSAPQPEATSLSSSPASEESAFLEDLTYQLYEDRWRGSMEAIRTGQMEYIEILRPHLQALSSSNPRTVLDVGCGRGEFLRLLREQGFSAKGVEINRVFAATARETGLDVELEDAIAYLRRQPDDSLGAVTAFQVLEHFPPTVLRQFLDLVQAKLVPGGVALFETLNPGTFAAFRWYLMDLTHERFLTPETARFLCECAGLEHVETRQIHPVGEWERLVETGDATEQENIRRLNATLYGPQDYFILVRKPLDDLPRKGESGA